MEKLLRIHREQVDPVAEQVADDAGRQPGVLIHEGRGLHPPLSAGAASSPTTSGATCEFPLAGLLRQLFSDGTDDDSAVIAEDVPDHAAKAGAHLAVGDLAAYSDM